MHHVYYHGGARRVCYTCIAAAGKSGATLHYGHAGAPNNRLVQDGAMLLFDFGAEYSGYCSDITCSFPASGKFTDKQKIVYNAVLRANRAVVAEARPGVSWSEMHLLANRVMLSKLLEAGILTGRHQSLTSIANRVKQMNPESGCLRVLLKKQAFSYLIC